MTNAEFIDSAGTDVECTERRGLRGRQIPLPLQVVACGLIGFGTLILGTVLSVLYATFQDVASNRFVATLARDMAAQPWIVSSDKSFSIQVSASATIVIALLLFLFFALLASFIGGRIIGCGVDMVSPQFKYQIARLKQRLNEIGAQVRFPKPPALKTR